MPRSVTLTGDFDTVTVDTLEVAASSVTVGGTDTVTLTSITDWVWIGYYANGIEPEIAADFVSGRYGSNV